MFPGRHLSSVQERVPEVRWRFRSSLGRGWAVIPRYIADRLTAVPSCRILGQQSWSAMLISAISCLALAEPASGRGHQICSGRIDYCGKQCVPTREVCPRRCHALPSPFPESYAANTTFVSIHSRAARKKRNLTFSMYSGSFSFI